MIMWEYLFAIKKIAFRMGNVSPKSGPTLCGSNFNTNIKWNFFFKKILMEINSTLTFDHGISDTFYGMEESFKGCLSGIDVI